MKKSIVMAVVNQIIGLYTKEAFTANENGGNTISFKDYCKSTAFPEESCLLSEEDKQQASKLIEYLAQSVDTLSVKIGKAESLMSLMTPEELKGWRHRYYMKNREHILAEQKAKPRTRVYDPDKRRAYYTKDHPTAKVVNRLSNEEKRKIVLMCGYGWSIRSMCVVLHRSYKPIKNYIEKNVPDYEVWISRHNPNQ